PRPAQAGGDRVVLLRGAEDPGEAQAAFENLRRAVEAFGRQHGRQHSVVRGLAGVQRLAVAAAILLHTGRLSTRDAEREGGLLRVQPEKPRRSGGSGHGSEGTGQMPAAEVMTGGGLSGTDPGFERRGRTTCAIHQERTMREEWRYWCEE